MMRISTTFAALLFAGALCVNAQSFRVAKTARQSDVNICMTSTPPAELLAPQTSPSKAKKHPIDEQPDGTLKAYAMDTYYYSQNMDEWVHRYGQKTMVVFNGDMVYIQNIINTNTYGTWIVGEISSDRKKVVFDNYQPYVEQGDYTYYVSLAKVNSNGDVFPDTEAEDFSLDYDEATGTLSNAGLNLSIVNEDGGVFTFNEGYNLLLFNDEPVQLPEGIGEDAVQPYSLKWESNDPYYFPRIVYVAQQGNDFYFKGFSTKTPDAWLKGTYDAAKDSIIIPNGQYVGLYDDLYFLYSKGATYTGMDSEGWPIYKNKDYASLKYNATDKSIYGPDGILFVLGKQLKGGYSQSIPSQDMKPFYGVAAKPKTPDIRNFYTDEVYGTESNLVYVVPVEDVNGNFISPDSLFYRIFIDGEQLHFDNSKDGYYPNFTDEWEVNCQFSDRGKWRNRTDNGNGTMTYHSMNIDKSLRPKTIGMQSVYYMNGTRTLSDICVFDTSTGAKSYVEGDADPSSVQSVTSSRQQTGQVFDLQGRAVNQPQKGLYISNGRKYIVK